MNDWLYLKTGFDEGIRLTAKLQAAFNAAYVGHVSGGQGLLSEAAIFVRSDAPEDSYEFYVSPQAATYLVGAAVRALGATACDAPNRHAHIQHRHKSLGLSIGEAGAWKLVQD